MIGHYLMTLIADQENAVLTKSMRPLFPDDSATIPGGGPCLVMTTSKGIRMQGLYGWHTANDWSINVGTRFDALCHRFGVARVNTAIRNRILANRVWRALQGVVLPHERRVLPEVTV